ncbi:MAG TPA: HAMP domain-containing sensor histidine kinase [Labilithrix sp.]|nr:HAMP domain-containing sensor histidine kinase [Labilithrix sp.]
MIVLSFVTATAIGQWRTRVLDDAVTEIAFTTAPSIEHLAAVRGEIRDLQGELREASGADDAQGVDAARRALVQSLNDYLVLPVAQRERPLWRDVFDSRAALDRALTRFESQMEADIADASRAEAAAAASELNGAITRAIAFNAVRSRDLALESKQLRLTASYVAIGLDVVCAAIAICGAILLRRLGRAHDALLATHLRLQEERASELEQFAGRVAHDILSPLSTVGLALQLVARGAPEQERARFLERGTAALERVKRLVSGLLDFARAGAAPEASSRADVAEVMGDLSAELEPTARAARVELRMKHQGACVVSCNPGVLTSLIANLARNAIKYIGDGPTRRVDVRAFECAEFVRVEVEDTGPGLQPEVENRVFDAYARARNSTQPGIGLGLATVKRLAEAHHGKVGVSSILGQGCTFWLELPKPGVACPAAPVRDASVP